MRAAASSVAAALVGLGVAAPVAAADPLAPPAPSLTGTAPASPGTSTTPSILGTAGPGSTVQLYGDACATPVGSPAVAGVDGTFAIAVEVAPNSTTTFRATASALGLASDCSEPVTYVNDLAPPPVPTITSGPPPLTAARDASLAFASEGASGYRCSLDGGPEASCDDGAAGYAGLADGDHGFAVRAVDALGNASDPATLGWTVDATPPAAPTFTAAPTDPSSSASGSFAFVAPGASGYTCSLDGAMPAACGGTAAGAVTYPSLAEGRHQLVVVAFDAAGNASPPASYAWAVDRTPPQTTISSGPSGVANERAGAFAFAASEPGSTFGCRLDGQSFASCTSPFAFAGLADGQHVFQVTAIDAAGNADPTPAARTWTVDTSLPQTTLLAAPSGATAETQAVLRFDSPLARATFECSLDGADYAPCTSPLSVGPLSTGPHAFFVRAVNVSLRDPSPAAAFWTVDPGAFTPPAQADATPPGKVRGLRALPLDRGARLTWTSPPDPDLSAVEITRRLGKQARVVFTGPATSFVDRGLRNGARYTYVVVAVDAAGNRSAPASKRVRPALRLLVQPADGAVVPRPPLLAWRPVRGAAFYNVQLFRGKTKLLSRWPRQPRLRLDASWTFAAKRRQLEPGVYVWYVWPAFGSRGDARYGKLPGRSVFVIKR